jgi:hypothetical protein
MTDGVQAIKFASQISDFSRRRPVDPLESRRFRRFYSCTFASDRQGVLVTLTCLSLMAGIGEVIRSLGFGDPRINSRQVLASDSTAT